MKLPPVSSEKVIKALARLGYEFCHQKGSHIHLRKANDPFNRVVVPKHRVLKKGTLLNIIKHAGLTKKEFIKFL